MPVPASAEDTVSTRTKDNVISAGDMCRVGQNHMYIRCIYSILAGKSLNIRSYTVYIYGSGQPYKLALPLMPGELPIPKVGQNQTFIGIYGVLYGISGREITIHTVIYGVYIRSWPTLPIP